MTKDLALLIGPDQPWLTTQQFLDALDARARAGASAPEGANVAKKPQPGRDFAPARVFCAGRCTSAELI